MKIAVTGATGFLGRHVLERLKREPVEIIAVGRDRAKWNGRGAFVEMDLAHPPPDLFSRLGQPDRLIHLAWEGLPSYNSLHHFETELPRQYGFLRTLIESGLSTMLVAGSSFEYGMRYGCLQEDLPSRPVNPYALAKDVLRQQLEFFLCDRATRLIWARVFYLWGEGQSAKSLFSSFHEAVARGDPTFPMSSGEQLRDYLHVATAADYLVRLALGQESEGIVNVCSGRPISVRRLVESWMLALNSNIRLDFGRYPYPSYEPLAFWGNDKKLMRILGSDVNA